MKLLVTTSEGIDPNREFRIELMQRTFSEISKIKTEHTKIVVYVNNVPEQDLKKFMSNFENIMVEIEFKVIDVVSTVGHGQPQVIMCWEHKKLIPEFLESEYTHFVYFENDLLFTQQNLDYWLETRSLFKKNNLTFVPAFHRIEISSSGQIVSLDATWPKAIHSILEIEGKKFASLFFPYHAMYVMDKELAQEHVQGHFYRPDGDKPGFRVPGVVEQSAVGNMFDNVPQGFYHRCLVPMEDFSRCWVHHTANKFVDDPDNSFGKLPIDQVL